MRTVRRMIRRCKTGKRIYETELAAKINLAFIPDKPKRQEQRAYRCEFCHCWHLTSKELRT